MALVVARVEECPAQPGCPAGGPGDGLVAGVRGWRRRQAALRHASMVLVVALVAGGGLTVRLPSTITFAIAFGLPESPAQVASRLAAGAPASWVEVENRRPGDGGWRIHDPGAPHAVEGYADHASAATGDQVTLYVSTVAPWFRVEAWRMGWYGGAGGRLVWRSGVLPGRRQADPLRDHRTNMVEARWRPSLRVAVDAGWPPGDYLLKLLAPGAGERYVPLTVRDDGSTAALVVLNAVTTWQAYNDWGGRSLYWGPGLEFALRSRVVSFDRPYAQGLGAEDFLGNELPLVWLVEQRGLDVTYWTDVDLHQHPERLPAHRGLVSLGHDEYWSTRMRRGVEQARDLGVNLAFLGANAIFRHIRLAPSLLGPDRREVNYKPAGARADPAWRGDRREVTTDWREPPLDQPESAVLGQQYECNPVRAAGVVATPGSWLLRGTGLAAGARLPNLIGPEYDRVAPGTPTPPTVELLLHSPLRCRGHRSFADVTYYTAPSGAGVLDTGTSSWVCQLAAACGQGRSNPAARAAVRQITLNALRAFSERPAGSSHPATPNLAAFHLRPSGL
jgi:hypothetical protein